jgi:hypothetical protein
VRRADRPVGPPRTAPSGTAPGLRARDDLAVETLKLVDGAGDVADLGRGVVRREPHSLELGHVTAERRHVYEGQSLLLADARRVVLDDHAVPLYEGDPGNVGVNREGLGHRQHAPRLDERRRERVLGRCEVGELPQKRIRVLGNSGSSKKRESSSFAEG